MAAGVSAPCVVDSRLSGQESFRFRHRQAVVVGIADPPSSNLNDQNPGNQPGLDDRRRSTGLTGIEKGNWLVC